MTTRADTSVKFGHSDIADSPVLSGQPGALIALLDAFLIDGYCTRSVDSITVADGVATVSISAGVPYPEHAVIALAGASPAALNDEWRIYDVGASTFKFNCPSVASGSATGTISAKMAPVGGWEKAFADTNKAAYRSTDVAAFGFYLRIDDTDARYARVRGYESMTGIDDGTNPFPTFEQQAATNFTWAKSTTANAVARKWALVADSRMMHVALAFDANAPLVHDYYRFGDNLPLAASDAWAVEIVAQQAASPGYPAMNNSAGVFQVSSTQGAYAPRAASGTPGAVQRVALSMLGSSQVGHVTTASPLLFLSSVVTVDGATATSIPRAVVPGLRVAVNRPASDIDYQVHAFDSDLLFHVRAGLTTDGDLRYGAFSLAPAEGWR